MLFHIFKKYSGVTFRTPAKTGKYVVNTENTGRKGDLPCATIKGGMELKFDCTIVSVFLGRARRGSPTSAFLQ
jgi:hypothetical protein